MTLLLTRYMQYNHWVFYSHRCANFTLTTPGSAVTREKGPLGPNSTPGQRWPGNQSNWQIMGSDWPSSWSYFASNWLISGSSLTRNGVWPQWTLFRVTLTLVFFRVFISLAKGYLSAPFLCLCRLMLSCSKCGLVSSVELPHYVMLWLFTILSDIREP